MNALTVDDAHFYARIGWHVLPVRQRDKVPLTEHAKDDATTDPTKISGWFAGRNGSAPNIGVACAPSGFVVIDIDLPKPKNKHTDGRKQFAELVDNLGPLPETVTADTGSGGTHYLFRAPAGVKLVGKYGKAIDINSNGMIVVAPSIHESGNPYRWRAGHAPGEIQMAVLPTAWIEHLRQPEPTARPASRGPATGEDFYSAVESLDQRYVLGCISGSSLVNGERFAFKSSGRGKYNLFVDRGEGFEGTSNFIDASGRIAARSTGKDDGGPLATQWCRYYRDDDKAIRAALIDLVPELARFGSRPQHSSSREPPAELSDDTAEAAAIHAEQLDGIGDGDASGTLQPRRYHRCPDLVAKILERAAEGFVSHTLGGQELYRLRLGGVAMLTGAPGAGKTSMAVGIGLEHARERGPVVYCSLEMDADELGARGIGMQCDASWEDVLCGRVRREFMDDALDLPRLVVLDGDDAKLAELERTVLAMSAEYRDEPILVIVDYLQIMPGDEREVRARVAAAAQAVRRLAKRLRVVVLAISQPSRAAGRALSAGELLGGDSMTAMAETAEIERAAYITLALGASGVEREDGSRVVDLSVGKGRFGGGDRVVPVSFWGRTGRMRIAGEGRPASEVKAEREGQRDSAKQRGAELAIAAAAGKATAPKTRAELGELAGVGSNTLRTAAIMALRGRDELVEVRQRANPRGTPAWKLWTRERAVAAGVEIVEVEA